MSGRTRTRDIMGLDMTPGNEDTFHGLARVLQAAGRSPKTISAYHQACLSLERHQLGAGRGPDLLQVTRKDAGDWLIGLQDYGGWTQAAAGAPVTRLGRPLARDSVVSYFGSARRFYNWAAAEELIGRSPMAAMTCPPPSGRPLQIPETGLIAAMLDSCKPKGGRPGFYDRRDEFMIRLFAETGGPRCSEVALLPLERLDMRGDLVTILGKGGKWRKIAMCARTAQAGARYLRLRAAHPDAETLPYVFLGRRGQLSADGVYKVIRRRAELAGGRVHPHQLRHLAAHLAKASGMADADIRELFGWESNRMVDRYGAALAGERAIAASRRAGLGNLL